MPITPPESFNAADYLVHRRVPAGDGERVALVHPGGEVSYAEVSRQVRAVAAGLTALGVHAEERVMFFAADCPELVAGLLGAMHRGAVAVPVSTMLTSADLAGLLADSRARVLVTSTDFVETARAAVASLTDPELTRVVTIGAPPDGFAVPAHAWEEFVSRGDAAPLYPSWADSPALWLYTSGTTGSPKAAMHRHGSIRVVSETYGQRVLGITAGDRCFSVAKLFFAYGIGNSLFFPFSVGAAAVLEPGRPTPALVADVVGRHRPTLFFGVPTFYSALLASETPDGTFAGVRQGVSAGEPLSATLFTRMRDRFGFEILDGIGSTEALHIFLSNYPGEVRPGTSGTPVPGYRVQLRDESDGSALDKPGESGALYVSGESVATGYWCRAEITRRAFQGDWLRTGDSYLRNDDGTYTHLGRSDDMIKAGGIWVSPCEVEARLLEHPGVVEAAVVGIPDADGLDKPVAAVVLRLSSTLTESELVAFCRAGLASFKRPRRIAVVDELPKTATGKLQRYLVRATLEREGERASTERQRGRSGTSPESTVGTAAGENAARDR